MKNINFENKSAKKIYESYIGRARKTLNVLSKQDRTDIMMEINSHIYEGLEQSIGENEVEKIIRITHSLGNPEEFLKPIIAQKKLGEATRTYNPKHIFQAIYLNIRNGVLFSVFALLYLGLIGFLILIISKIRYPQETGLFLNDGKFEALGRLRTTENVEEVLGDFFIPAMFLMMLGLYLLVTFLLRLSKKK